MGYGVASILDHTQGSLTITRLQSEKERAGLLDILVGTGFDSGPEGHRCRMIRATDENQRLGQAPDRRSVDCSLVHSHHPRAVRLKVKRIAGDWDFREKMHQRAAVLDTKLQ
jgi:hypothetical protein